MLSYLLFKNNNNVKKQMKAVCFKRICHDEISNEWHIRLYNCNMYIFIY